MFDRLRSELVHRRLDGPVYYPGDLGYEQRRRVWNAMVDRRPLAILACHTVDDVIQGIRIAQDVDVELGVRCGGHSIIGHAVPERGLMLDLRALAKVHVDPVAQTAIVQGGALLGALDRATQHFGLATTTGNVSHTGVGGLTLGGGMGWLGRQYGLTCDNVLACQVVTAAGEVVEASAESHPDLFWALKGGGGNFGVVTEFTFQLHPVRSRVLSVEAEFPAHEARDAVVRWRDLSREAPRQATFVAEVYGGVALLGCVWVGDLAQGYEFAKLFCDFPSEPAEQRVEEMSYLELQAREDTPQDDGGRRYWKGFYLDDLPDDAIRAFLGHDPGFAGSIISHGGAIGDVPSDQTAFSHRDVGFEYVGALRWTDPAEDSHWMRWGREQAAALAEFASGTYVNTLQTASDETLRTAYSAGALDRLRATKSQWDPENVFHLNHNIRAADLQHGNGGEVIADKDAARRRPSLSDELSRSVP